MLRSVGVVWTCGLRAIGECSLKTGENIDGEGGVEAAALIGNAFPLSLVRGHHVVIDELPMAELRSILASSEVVSFWGHENTRPVAEAVVGVSLKPARDRPAMMLDDEGYPTLDGRRFRICYVLSPDYAPGCRPAIGAEVAPEDIRAWHALRLEWGD